MSTEFGRIKWDISPWALILLALWYFFDESGMLALIVPAVLAHEGGHALFLGIGGLRLRSVSLGIFGLEMDYFGQLAGLKGALAIAMGPVFGLAYGTACVFSHSEFWNLSGSMSILLSVFNLLPVLPLDGGRLLRLGAGERGEMISRGICAVLAVLGAWLWLTRGWFSLFIMGIWLMCCNINPLLQLGRS